MIGISDVGSVWRLREGRGLPYRYRIRGFTLDNRIVLVPVGAGRGKTIKLRTLLGDYERVKA